MKEEAGGQGLVNGLNGLHLAFKAPMKQRSFPFNLLIKTACARKEWNTMGKGDRRTKRGKIWSGTNGKSRPKKVKKNKTKK
jgi:30S ribosomal protein S31